MEKGFSRLFAFIVSQSRVKSRGKKCVGAEEKGRKFLLAVTEARAESRESPTRRAGEGATQSFEIAKSEEERVQKLIEGEENSEIWIRFKRKKKNASRVCEKAK